MSTTTIVDTGTGRRGLIAGATAALAAAVAATTGRAAPVRAGDDAELLELVRKFREHDAVVRQWNADRVSEAVGEEALRRWWLVVDRVQEMAATTDAGIFAKTQILTAIIRCAADPCEPETYFAESLERDLAAKVTA